MELKNQHLKSQIKDINSEKEKIVEKLETREIIKTGGDDYDDKYRELKREI